MNVTQTVLPVVAEMSHPQAKFRAGYRRWCPSNLANGDAIEGHGALDGRGGAEAEDHGVPREEFIEPRMNADEHR